MKASSWSGGDRRGEEVERAALLGACEERGSFRWGCKREQRRPRRGAPVLRTEGGPAEASSKTWGGAV